MRDLLTPLPSRADPADSVLTAAIGAFLKDSGAPVASRYDFRRYDLDGDGMRDALALFKSPYGYWCGLHGCTLLVMRAVSADTFEIASTIQPVREPLYVGSGETNGWKDIIVHVSGRWSETKDVALHFDGKTYPGNPSDLPAYKGAQEEKLARLFYD